ncbi:MAG TPA: alpha-amylase family glycosyl hydrolase [Thermoanaerobaculia bacterium]
MAAAALFLACGGAPAPRTAASASAPAAAKITVVPQESWRDGILYFVITDRFADGDPANDLAVDRGAKGAFHGGDLKGLTEHLDEIADLGVTALWITPVVKNIDGFVSGSGMPDWGYHGYWADDFYRLDPRFGTEAELKDLVDAAHARGMKVLLDVVYNHAGYDSNLLKDPQTRGWFRSEALGTCGQDDLTTCVGGLPDFKTELPEVRDYLMKAHLGLAQRVGVDGFRLDTVKNVGHDFWQEHRKRTREQLGNGFFLLGEVWGGDAQVLDPYFSADELDAGFDFSFAGNAIGWVTGRGRTVAFDHYLKTREKVRAGHLLSPYLSSHDVPGALFQLKGDKELFRLAALLELTAAGMPMIYYGEEVGRPGGDWPDNRSDMPWGDRRIFPGAGQPRDEALRSDYKKMVALRRAHPAFARGVHSAIATDGDLLVFLQRDEASHDAVVVAINRGSAPATAAFDAPAEWGTAAPRDVWTGQPVAAAGGKIEAVVAPKSARIFAIK